MTLAEAPAAQADVGVLLQEQQAMLTIEQRRKGGQMRARQFTTDHQRAAGQARAARGDMAEIGRKGWLVTSAKYGSDIALEKARTRRLARPSCHERKVIEILAGLGYVEGAHYEREAKLIEGTYFTVDFYFPASRKVIEVNGEVHYQLLFQDDAGRSQREQEKLTRLAELGIEVLVLDYRELDAANIKHFLTR